MWLIFIMACVVAALAGMVTLWICKMLYISMERRITEFKKEMEKENSRKGR